MDKREKLEKVLSIWDKRGVLEGPVLKAIDDEMRDPDLIQRLRQKQIEKQQAITFNYISQFNKSINIYYRRPRDNINNNILNKGGRVSNNNSIFLLLIYYSFYCYCTFLIANEISTQ